METLGTKLFLAVIVQCVIKFDQFRSEGLESQPLFVRYSYAGYAITPCSFMQLLYTIHAPNAMRKSHR
jgi:hypothetical protein